MTNADSLSFSHSLPMSLSRGLSCDAALCLTDELILITGFPHPLHPSLYSCLHINAHPCLPAVSCQLLSHLFKCSLSLIHLSFCPSLSLSTLVLSSLHQCLMLSLHSALIHSPASRSSSSPSTPHSISPHITSKYCAVLVCWYWHFIRNRLSDFLLNFKHFCVGS